MTDSDWYDKWYDGRYDNEWYDEVLTAARGLASLVTHNQVRDYYERKYPEGHPAHDVVLANPEAAFFGAATLVITDLLGIIHGKNEEIGRLNRIILGYERALDNQGRGGDEDDYS